jgi:hypothetical protein
MGRLAVDARGNPLDDRSLPKLGLAAHIRSAVSGGQCFSAAKSLTLEVNYRAGFGAAFAL